MKHWFIQHAFQCMIPCLRSSRISQRRVRRQYHLMLFAVFTQCIVRQIWMSFTLQHRRSNLAVLQHIINLRCIEIGQSDMFGESQTHALLHSFPCVFMGDNLTIIQSAVFSLWKRVRSAFECQWPVHEIQIDVFQSQIGQCLFQCRHYVVRMMLGVPQLGSHEDVFSFDASVQCCLDALPDFLFIAVGGRRVNVSVSDSQCIFHGGCYFAFIR
mmetsp:Transcript_51246/g.81659  ORF Transcript_51246/g.81659 Transcript_51246/m.81659 type:complete len:213 (-) Transcript_51246:225-863(-)